MIRLRQLPVEAWPCRGGLDNDEPLVGISRNPVGNHEIDKMWKYGQPDRQNAKIQISRRVVVLRSQGEVGVYQHGVDAMSDLRGRLRDQTSRAVQSKRSHGGQV